jgi:hypothetical protein
MSETLIRPSGSMTRMTGETWETKRALRPVVAGRLAAPFADQLYPRFADLGYASFVRLAMGP